MSAVTPAEALAANCSGTSVGLVPLTDLGPALYRGAQGGLYPGAVNAMPQSHAAAGLREAESVVPRDAAGAPDPVDGRIVLLSIGMSNCRMETDGLIALAGNDPLRDPRVLIVNGAQNAMTAEVIDDPAAPFWANLDDTLASRGVTPAQVQAIWFKETNAAPQQSFPEFPILLAGQFAEIMRIARARFPNARLCYASSRTYGGYASTPLNPEPFAYESGFAVKRLVRNQLDGDPALNFDAALGPVVAPWIAWGPYLWADGLTPRSDGLTWECGDFWEIDGTHPTASGVQKVAERLLAFLRTEPTAAAWYLSDSPTDVAGPGPDEREPAGPAGPAGARASEDAGSASLISLETPRPNPFNPSVTIPVVVRAPGRVRLDVVSPSGRIVATLVDGDLAAGRHRFAWDGLDESGLPAASGTYFVRGRDGASANAYRKIALVR